MPRSVILATLAALALFAGCTSAVPPSAPPTAPPDSPSPSPAPELTEDERYLLDGVLRDARDCVPVRDELPARALAAIDCVGTEPAVARLRFVLFFLDDDLLAAYRARMEREGVAPESGTCSEGEREGAYVPGGLDSPWRHGCFVDSAGHGTYLATLPISRVLLELVGAGTDLGVLEAVAFRGSTDVPGNPTLWGLPG